MIIINILPKGVSKDIFVDMLALFMILLLYQFVFGGVKSGKRLALIMHLGKKFSDFKNKNFVYPNFYDNQYL